LSTSPNIDKFQRICYALPGSTAQDFFRRWAANKVRETAQATGRRYSDVAGQFLTFLGPKAEAELNDITRADITSFRDSLHDRLSASTANLALKIVRMALKDAQIDGYVDRNVAVGIKFTKNRKAKARRPFTLPELKKILSKAHGEWRGLHSVHGILWRVAWFSLS
jgi:integrase